MKVRAIKLLIREAEELFKFAQQEKEPFLKEIYIKATIAFSWFSLEGCINLIISDFLSLKTLPLHERAFLEEKNLEFSEGDFLIRGRKYHSTKNKLLFLLKKYGQYEPGRSSYRWNKLSNLEDWRDDLVHPKERNTISKFTVRNAGIAQDTVKNFINLLYKKIYKKRGDVV